MRHRFRSVLILVLLTITLVFTIVISTLMWPWRERVNIVTDPLYRMRTLDAREVFRLRYLFALQGYKLRVIEIELATILDEETVSKEIGELIRAKDRILLTSPLLTRALRGVREALDAETEGTLLVGGIGGGSEGDFSLVRTIPDSGWTDAARSLMAVVHDNPLPTALLYDAEDLHAAADAELFASHFSAPLEHVAVKETSDRSIESLMERLSRDGVNLVVVPHLNNLDRYLASSKAAGMRWVVDSSHASLVEPAVLEGALVDDLFLSLLPLLGKTDETGGAAYPLVKIYRGGSRGYRN